MATMKEKAPPRQKLTGAVFAMWREQMGYSQRAAAEELGCAPQSILNWEKGHSEIPRYIGFAMAALAVGMRPYGEKNDAPAGDE